ncbi:hypothetical protein PanWU01x14_192780 [Parasponia andersonii]|uniref:Uncharacterized protein n=1 Tax=Parasponia andersonii TaxID=3476 RepID=A0A2P5C135_PARAD|nr:hypothetical protein PanWU01x14_192780 [Parasponia andersonii]
MPASNQGPSSEPLPAHGWMKLRHPSLATVAWPRCKEDEFAALHDIFRRFGHRAPLSAVSTHPNLLPTSNPTCFG